MLKALRSTINAVLALAVTDLFPGVILGKSHVSDTVFCYQFHFPQGKHPELLLLIEEKMRAVLKSDLRIECIEMATSNAIAYFEHHEQPFKADMAADSEDQTLSLIRIGSFYDLITFDPELSLPSLCFQLLEAKTLEKDDLTWIEITGTAFETKDDLKAFIKLRKQWLKEKPWEEAARLGLITSVEDKTILLPNGVEISHLLENIWRKSIKSKDFLEIITQNPDTYPSLCQKLKSPIAEWGVLLANLDDSSDLSSYLVNPNQMIISCISSLQFIHQTFNMLELNMNWVLCIKSSNHVQKKQWEHEVNILTKALDGCGFLYSIDLNCESIHPSIELRIADSIGELKAGPFLSVNSNLRGSLKEASITYSLLGPIKRLVALLAEHRSLDALKVLKFNVGES